MNLFRKSVLSFAGVAAAALLLALVSPRTVHAISAELVRISNTADAPAIVENVPHLASHLIYLIGSEQNPGNTPLAELGPDGTVITDDYVVPAGQKLVITGIDFVNASATNVADAELKNNNGGYYGVWQVQGLSTTEYQYPSGIVVASGTNLQLSVLSGGAYVALHGYLTTE
jgi:hypothetical protein